MCGSEVDRELKKMFYKREWSALSERFCLFSFSHALVSIDLPLTRSEHQTFYRSLLHIIGTIRKQSIIERINRARNLSFYMIMQKL